MPAPEDVEAADEQHVDPDAHLWLQTSSTEPGETNDGIVTARTRELRGMRENERQQEEEVAPLQAKIDRRRAAVFYFYVLKFSLILYI